LCWAIRERRGDAGLDEMLDGYTAGRPFLAVSDGFPQGLLPRPAAPDVSLGLEMDPAQRKKARTLRWLPAAGATQPVKLWLEQLVGSDMMRISVVSQNTINRFTGTTGTGPFAPRQVDRLWFDESARLDLYVVLDEDRLPLEHLKALLDDIGLHGYGRDATTGSGKFAVDAWCEAPWPTMATQWWLTLAPCAPDPALLEADRCSYLPLTRFGRHGNVAVMRGNPFKSPLLMAATGALLRSREPAKWAFHGRGLGGRIDSISGILPQTVHQGYAPVVPLTMAT
jgi:CRISPR-associated protein Csm4